VLLHVDFWQQNGTSAYFTFGPSLALRVDDAVEGDAGTWQAAGRADAAWNLSIGLEMGPVVVDGRSSWGWRSPVSVDGRPAKHRTLSLTLGWRFR
jgi:hypothetical protein